MKVNKQTNIMKHACPAPSISVLRSEYCDRNVALNSYDSPPSVEHKRRFSCFRSFSPYTLQKFFICINGLMEPWKLSIPQKAL